MDNSEILKDLGVVKSSYGLIQLAMNSLQKYILKPDETPNESPASFMNIFLEMFGRMGAISFYEQMMYKNEMTPSTAIRLRSLINKLNDSTIANMYAQPAEMTFVLAFEKNALINTIKSYNRENYLTLNKDCKFNVSGLPEFTLDHNIKIIASNLGAINQNIYAMFDISDKINPNSNLTNVNNPFISSQLIRNEEKDFFAMFIPGRQYYRTIKEIEVLNDNADFTFNYDQKLYGFELSLCKKGSSSYVYIPGKPDGNIASDGYNFNIRLDTKEISVSFNKNPDYFKPEIGDKIKVKICTTLGSEGNFEIPDIYSEYENIHFTYAQNRAIATEERLLKLTPWLSLRNGISEFGKDMMNFEEIRSTVIERGYNSRIVTLGELERECSKLGFSTKRIRHDIRCLECLSSGVLKLTDGTIISSKNATLSFNFEDIPIISEVNARIITPKDIFRYNKSSGLLEYTKERLSLEEYYEKYRTNEIQEFVFPYHIRFSATSVLSATIFKMNLLGENFSTNFVFFNENTTDESSILNLYTFRDPSNESIEDVPGGSVENPHSKGYITIGFDVTTSSNVIDNMKLDSENPINKYRITIESLDTHATFGADCHIAEIDSEKRTVSLKAYLKTDNAISDNDRLCIRDYSLFPIPTSNDPIEYYFIGEKVKIQIYCLQRNLNGVIIKTTYDGIIKPEELPFHYFVSTVYEVPEVQLFEKYDDLINLVSDARINQAIPKRYEENVVKRYSENVYLKDENGIIVTIPKTVVIGNEEITIQEQVLLHSKGDIVYDGENPVYEHVKGDTVLDPTTGNYIYEKGETYTGLIKGAPIFDRMFAFGSGFNDVLRGYESLIANIKSLSTMALDGVKLFLGLKTTTGPGEYEVFNMEFGLWEDINDISLSFDIGVKYSDSVVGDSLINNSLIVTEIVNYINNFTGISFSINDIFNQLKDTFQNIEYLILYKINNYPSNRVQSIRKKDAALIVQDQLSVRQIIDLNNSNLENEEIVFKPDITVRILEN
jgi:hypothetical protein